MIRIVLIDDHAVVRTGYRRLLDAEPGMQVVGEAASADEANALVLRTMPDVALVDLSLRGSSGIKSQNRTQLPLVDPPEAGCRERFQTTPPGSPPWPGGHQLRFWRLNTTCFYFPEKAR